MLIEERHRAILEILHENGKITTSLIQRKFGVGYGTAVRDLDILEDKGLIQRTYGGAVEPLKVGYAPGISDLSSKERCENVREEYIQIAKAAVGMIEDDDIVFITSASVGYLIARELRNKIKCTVVTNSSSVAEELRGKLGSRVIVTGGELNENGNFYDDFTLSAINKMRFDKCFITSAACSVKFGLSIQNDRGIGITKAVCKNSKKVIGLFPSEKIGHDSFLQICPLSTLDVIITDSGISDENIKGIRESGVELTIAE